MRKDEKFGCDKCPDYLPSHGKVVNGVVLFPGIGNVPTAPGNGRCELIKRMVRRMKACPRGGERC